jgi:hypothetical protein
MRSVWRNRCAQLLLDQPVTTPTAILIDERARQSSPLLPSNVLENKADHLSPQR